MGERQWKADFMSVNFDKRLDEVNTRNILMRILHTFSDADSAHTTDIHTRGACKRCRWFLELLAPVSVSASPRFTLTWEFLKQLHANRSAKRRAQEKENLVPSARICVCIKACVTTYLCFNDKSHFTLHMLHKIWNPPIDSLSYSNQSFPWQLSTVVCPSRQLDLRRWRYNSYWIALIYIPWIRRWGEIETAVEQ